VKFARPAKPARHFVAAVLCFVLSLAGIAAAHAEVRTAPLVQQSAEVAEKYGHGLLWRIDRTGMQPSYLFGTYHSEDPRVLNLPPIVRQVFDASDNLVLEIDMGSNTRQAARELLFYQDGRTLRGTAGDELFQAAAVLLSTYNLATDTIMQLKPWAAFMLLNTPRPETGLFLDYKLYLLAQEQDKPVLHLESPDEQLAALDGLPLQQQNRLLRHAVENHAVLGEQLQEVTQAYLARDLRTLIALNEKHTPRDEPVFTTLMDVLLVQRNRRMLQRMEVLLEYGNVFIAVGALHLAGNAGLLNRLAQRGYKVSRIY
jgi:uncharacterized protein YbaP (TraB family)